MLMSGCFSSVSQVYRKRDRLDPGGDNRCDGAEHDRGCATSFAGGDCSFVAGEIAASQKIERVSLSRPAASERLATSISLAVGRRQRGAAGYETGLTGSVVVSQRRCPARRYHYYLIQYHAVIARQDAHDEAQTDAMASQFLGTGQGSSAR